MHTLRAGLLGTLGSADESSATVPAGTLLHAIWILALLLLPARITRASVTGMQFCEFQELSSQQRLAASAQPDKEDVGTGRQSPSRCRRRLRFHRRVQIAPIDRQHVPPLMWYTQPSFSHTMLAADSRGLSSKRRGKSSRISAVWI